MPLHASRRLKAPSLLRTLLHTPSLYLFKACPLALLDTQENTHLPPGVCEGSTGPAQF